MVRAVLGLVDFFVLESLLVGFEDYSREEDLSKLVLSNLLFNNLLFLSFPFFCKPWKYSPMVKFF